MYFKSKKELNYDRFVDLNILGAARLVHSDLQIYRILFFLLVIMLIFHDWTQWELLLPTLILSVLYPTTHWNQAFQIVHEDHTTIDRPSFQPPFDTYAPANWIVFSRTAFCKPADDMHTRSLRSFDHSYTRYPNQLNMLMVTGNIFNLKLLFSFRGPPFNIQGGGGAGILGWTNIFFSI